MIDDTTRLMEQAKAVLREQWIRSWTEPARRVASMTNGTVAHKPHCVP